MIYSNVSSRHSVSQFSLETQSCCLKNVRLKKMVISGAY